MAEGRVESGRPLPIATRSPSASPAIRLAIYLQPRVSGASGGRSDESENKVATTYGGVRDWDRKGINSRVLSKMTASVLANWVAPKTVSRVTEAKIYSDKVW